MTLLYYTNGFIIKLIAVKGYSATVSLAELASANIVGYTTTPIEGNKWYMIAPSFEDVGSAEATTVDLIKTLSISGVTVETWSNRANATQIQVFNPATGGYTLYYYTVNAGVTGWRRSPSVATELPIKVGTGVWLKVMSAESGANVTFAGQVRAAETTVVKFGDEGTWTMVSNPYPTPLTQGKLVTTGITAQTWSNRASASQLQVFNPASGGYSIYYYTSGVGGNCWRNSPSAPSADAVICPAGASFWVKSSAEGTLTFSL